MSASGNRFARVLLAAVSLIAASTTPAYVHFRDAKTNLPIKWGPGFLDFRVDLGGTKTLLDGSTYNSSFQAAADIWTAKLGSVVLRATVAAGTPAENNKVNDVFFSATIFGRDFGTDILAVATRWNSGNRRTEADIIFNTAYTWDSYRGNIRFSNGVRLDEMRRVSLHELGHALGLTHPDEDGQTVAAVMNFRESNTDNLTSDDTAGGQAIYGPPGIAANDSFANATELFLAASNAFSVTGFNTNCSKEPGEPLHANTGGGRSIWYKWTAPGDGGATLDTLSSNCDTTLAVYTGTTLASLAPLAYNDDIDPATNWLSKLTFYARQGTTYYIAVDGRNGDAAGITLSMVLDPNAAPPPTISTQPASVTVNAGERASFSVTATGTGTLTYQWRLNDTAIAGATAATYEIASAATTHAGNYTVVVANSAGTVTSNPAKLTVQIPPPAISTQPGNLSLTSGGRGTLSVTATGTGTLTYQWRLNGTAIAGATSSSYEIANATQSDAGTYTVVVTASGSSTTSNAATVTVSSPTPTPAPSSSGGGGGGGAPSLWFCGALALAAAVRRLGRHARC